MDKYFVNANLGTEFVFLEPRDFTELEQAVKNLQRFGYDINMISMTIIPGVTPTELKGFVYRYNKGRNSTYKHLRFGQAFLNEFYPDDSCPELYYEQDFTMSLDFILTNFVDNGSETLLDILWS